MRPGKEMLSVRMELLGGNKKFTHSFHIWSLLPLSIFTKYITFKSHLQSIQGKICRTLKIYVEKFNTYQVEVLGDLQNIGIDHDPWVLKAELGTFLNCNSHRKVFQEDVQS